MDTVYSAPFKVYAPKYFPGIHGKRNENDVHANEIHVYFMPTIESTEFSRCFASQGLKIAVRSVKEARKGKRKEHVDNEARIEQGKASSLKHIRNDPMDDDHHNHDTQERVFSDNHGQSSSLPYSRIDISSVLHPSSSP